MDFVLYSLHRAVQEAVHEQCTRRGTWNAPAFQVKYFFLLDLADGGGVRALYVVVLDFQLRTGIRPCTRIEQQDMLVQKGVGVFSVFADFDHAVQFRKRMVSCDAPNEYVSAGVFSDLLEERS